MLDFLSVTWHRRSSCHCISWKATETKSFIGMHIILHRRSPQIRSGDVNACKRNVWSNVCAFSLACFSGTQHILPSFGRRLQSSFGAKKSCTDTVQIFILHSCILGRIEDCRLSIKICPSSKVKKFRTQEINFWKSGPYWDICAMTMRINYEQISAGSSPWVPTLRVGRDSCVPFCMATQTSVLN